MSLLVQRLFQAPSTPLWCVCVCRGKECFTSYLDQVMNTIVFIMQVTLKFSVQGVDSTMKPTIKLFIWPQLIMYEFIHFLAGISPFKDSLLFRGREVEAGIPSEVIRCFNGNT